MKNFRVYTAPHDFNTGLQQVVTWDCGNEHFVGSNGRNTMYMG